MCAFAKLTTCTGAWKETAMSVRLNKSSLALSYFSFHNFLLFFCHFFFSPLYPDRATVAILHKIDLALCAVPFGDKGRRARGRNGGRKKPVANQA